MGCERAEESKSLEGGGCLGDKELNGPRHFSNFCEGKEYHISAMQPR